jgi:hypothetical protein
MARRRLSTAFNGTEEVVENPGIYGLAVRPLSRNIRQSFVVGSPKVCVFQKDVNLIGHIISQTAPRSEAGGSSSTVMTRLAHRSAA